MTICDDCGEVNTKQADQSSSDEWMDTWRDDPDVMVGKVMIWQFTSRSLDAVFRDGPSNGRLQGSYLVEESQIYEDKK